MKHAPRGPIKSRPMEPGTHGRCTAKSTRTGQQCKRAPIRGGTVCATHGGSAPQVRAAAEKRLEELKPAAIQYLGWLVTQRDYPSAGLGAAKDIMDRTDGKPRETVDVNLTTEVQNMTDDQLRDRALRLTGVTGATGR